MLIPYSYYGVQPELNAPRGVRSLWGRIDPARRHSPMSYRLVAAPGVLPLSVAEAKEQCHVSHAEEDQWFAAAIASATETVQNRTGRVLIAQTWDLMLDCFGAGEIALNKPPVRAVTSITYADVDGIERAVPRSMYAVDTDTMPGYVLPAVGYAWPPTLSASGAVRIRFEAGYGAAADVPAAIKHWMLMQIAAAYRTRESFVVGATAAALPNRFVDSLLDEHTVYAWVFG